MGWRPNGLARASVRFRPSSFVGTFVALSGASAVVSAAALFLQTGVTTSAEPDRYAAAPVVVAAGDEVTERGDDGWTVTLPLAERPLVDADLAAQLAAVPGVGVVVPDVSFPVAPTGDAAGPTWPAAGWSATALEPGASAPAADGPADGEVVLDTAAAEAAGVSAGDEVQLRTAAGTAAFTVAALRDAPEAGAAAWFADDAAPALAGHPGRVDAVALLPARGASATELAGEVREALADGPAPATGFTVATGDERGEVETAGFGATRETLIAIGGSLGGVLLVVAVFVVMSTTSLAVEQRARELALLRAIGATPRQLRRTVATEAAVVSLLAAPLGLVPGVLIARWLLTQMTERGYLVPGIDLDAGPLALGVTVAVVAGAALVAGLLAARRPARVRPAEALRDSAVTGGRLGPLRWVLGLLALAGSVPLAIVSATSPGDLGMGLSATVVLTLLLAVGFLGPVLAAVISRVVAPLLDRLGAPGRLAAANGITNARRLASAITPLVMAVAFAGTTLFLQESLQRATTEQRQAALTADTVVDGGAVGLPADAATEAAALPGVEAATGVLSSTVITRSMGELAPQTADGLSGDLSDLARTLDVGVRDGDLSRLRPGTGDDDGTVALDAMLADSLDATVGSTVDLVAADGSPLRPEVVAVYTRGLGSAAVLLPADTVRAHAPAATVGQLLVRHDGAVGEVGRAALAELAGPAGQVRDTATVVAGERADAVQSSWLNNVFAAALAGFAAIAAANTLVMIALARQREVGLLGMIGATPRQVLRTARLEALVVSGSAIVLGSAIAWGTLQPSVRGATGAGPYVPPLLAVSILAGVVVLTLVCTGAPTRVVLRRVRATTVGTRE